MEAKTSKRTVWLGMRCLLDLRSAKAKKNHDSRLRHKRLRRRTEFKWIECFVQSFC
uniref:Uncharacterized protein n=1 Tax=Coccidioides posadasii RMSCC 3488 TaxID=454284 RepID=A0A0J6FKK0_COCPO|nr:hypothetical protein CPAG_05689 [Coccidioides posadasii RMSCC 3488]